MTYQYILFLGGTYSEGFCMAKHVSNMSMIITTHPLPPPPRPPPPLSTLLRHPLPRCWVSHPHCRFHLTHRRRQP
jgi:hypothetical protein